MQRSQLVCQTSHIPTISTVFLSPSFSPFPRSLRNAVPSPSEPSFVGAELLRTARDSVSPAQSHSFCGVFPQFETTSPACRHPPSIAPAAPRTHLSHPSAGPLCQLQPSVPTANNQGLNEACEAAGCSPTWPAQEGEGGTAVVSLVVASPNFFAHPCSRLCFSGLQRWDPCERWGRLCTQMGASSRGALLMPGGLQAIRALGCAELR